ncbi:MAG: tRNA 2-selenouridine(34) synthase MnmH [Bacteroidota bacterium]
MNKTLPITQFLPAYWQGGRTLVDVRSPKEFAKGHIPGAINIPLFTDEERAIVGTLYKQQGQQPALLRGLDIVGPKLSQFVHQLQNQSQTKQVFVHCWRGGMRSQSLAQLWQAAGFDVSVLQGGYKAYRRQVQACFAERWDLLLLGGSTGCGKTAILHSLREQGQQILDLEGLASHRGSAFGALGQDEQPSVEQFENNCYEVLRKLDPKRSVWVEDESYAIGRVNIPHAFWQQMKAAPVYVLDLPHSLRAARLMREYGSFHAQDMIDALGRIRKRLGGKVYQDAVAAIESGDQDTAVTLTMAYYDKAYRRCLTNKNQIQQYHLSLSHDEPANTARRLYQLAETQSLTHESD